MSILIIAEHHEGKLSHNVRPVVTAAKEIGGEIHVLVAGQGIGSVADAARTLDGVAKVITVDDGVYKDYLAENLAPLTVAVAKEGGYSHVLAPATAFGKDFMPRVAVALDVQQISDIIRVETADTFVRPIYAGNALATVQSSDAVKVITVRTSTFDKCADGGNAAVESRAGAGDAGLSEFVNLATTGGDKPDLTAASIVVSGGRGVGSKEDFKIIEDLADKLGGAVGASRAAVDSGYAPNDWQVGQTGKVVAPDLYIAIGLSGAIQHLAGMKGSKVIVAINKDENAPIFEVADYGLVADLFTAVPEMMQQL